MDYHSLARKVIQGHELSRDEAEELLSCPDQDVFALGNAAHRITLHYRNNDVNLCSLINAKSGSCSENCSFCAQSGHYSTESPRYSLADADTIHQAARQAADHGASRFSIVTSGRGITSQRELDIICEAVSRIRSTLRLRTCASLGILSVKHLRQLKDAGLVRYHHNLETSRSFFPSVCSTHTYQERVQTLQAAAAAGLEVCSGGIFGLGETPAQQAELAFDLRNLEVESVPINILHPIPGTPAGEAPSLTPLQALRLIATCRFILPSREIGVMGGRQSQLRDLQALILISGADFILLGDYLTTRGRPSEEDISMIQDLGRNRATYARENP